jgi:apolipoprotein N-acyltransferase
MHLLIAAAASVTDRLRTIPTEFWVKTGVGIAVLVVTVLLLRKLAKTNKVLLAAIVGVFLTVAAFNWIYERNEPEWATPAVAWLAEFLPSKGKLK